MTARYNSLTFYNNNMKRSKAVPLLMLGTLGILSGCAPSPDTVEVRQNNYRNMEDCRKDWGKDADRECRRSGGGYVGPRYVWNHTGGYPMAVNNDGSTRQLSNSYLNRPGSTSSAVNATVTRSNVSSFRSGAVSGASVSRGGFGGTSHGFSSGG